MNTKKRDNIELRYYEIPQTPPLIALLGDRWVLNYGTDPTHFHNFMEIGYCYYGRGTMYFGSEELEFQDGSITVIPVNFPHHTKSEGESISKWEYIYVDTERFLSEIFEEKPLYEQILKGRLNSRPLLLSESVHPVIGQNIRLILDEMRHKKEYYQDTVQGYLLALLLNVVRLNPAVELKGVAESGDGNFDRLTGVIKYISENYQQEMKIGELAEICHMSESHFRRVFVESMNVPPLEYVNLVRIQKACELLIRSEESLENIGKKVGYYALATFVRNFKKVVGSTPGQWRAAARQNEGGLVHYKVSIHKGW